MRTIVASICLAHPHELAHCHESLRSSCMLADERRHVLASVVFPYGRHNRVSLCLCLRKTEHVFELFVGNIQAGFHYSNISYFGFCGKAKGVPAIAL